MLFKRLFLIRYSLVQDYAISIRSNLDSACMDMTGEFKRKF